MNPTERARGRRLRRICAGLEIDVFAGEIIVDLLEQLEETRRELERLRALVETRAPRGR